MAILLNWKEVSTNLLLRKLMCKHRDSLTLSRCESSSDRFDSSFDLSFSKSTRSMQLNRSKKNSLSSSSMMKRQPEVPVMMENSSNFWSSAHLMTTSTPKADVRYVTSVSS
uniref:Uncharacterized protein n=1 Tax=Ditylenchus dipsaci TaxID=166011 RepID=A0A915ERQ7_9BILA